MNSLAVAVAPETSASSSDAQAKPRPQGNYSQFGRRLRQIAQVLRSEGVRGVSDRLRRFAAERLAPTRTIPPVRAADVIAVDLSQPFQPPIPPLNDGELILANWVVTPPAPGSGGHTTLFRMVRYLEAHGYRNRIYFYDAYRGDPQYYEFIVRRYYGFQGPIGDVNDGMQDAHIVFATGWPTAYAVFNARCAGKRFYFVQDFEPFFYPVGSTSSLAEITYRMRFHGLIIGKSFAEKLRTDFGMTVDPFEFACDVSQYRRVPGVRRSGIVLYVRKDSARRGLELGVMTLELFARRRPEVEIHVYGDKLGKQPFAFHDHGRVSPVQLNEIYNRCIAGLCLSFTNVSLVPLEMLAAGCIPVVNDTPHVRADLTNPFVVPVPPYPQALSAQLEALIDTPDLDDRSAAAARSVHAATWDEAGATVDAMLRRALLAPPMEA